MGDGKSRHGRHYASRTTVVAESQLRASRQQHITQSNDCPVHLLFCETMQSGVFAKTNRKAYSHPFQWPRLASRKRRFRLCGGLIVAHGVAAAIICWINICGVAIQAREK